MDGLSKVIEADLANCEQKVEEYYSKPQKLARDPAVIAECNDKLIAEAVDMAQEIGKIEGRSECISKLYKLGYGEAAAGLIVDLYGKKG